MNELHVLIIEDQYFIACEIEDALRQDGFASFDFASSRDEAVASAEVKCPDLVIADYNLVDSNGVDAVLHICQTQSIPVVFVTASGDVVRERMPDAFIVGKPFHQNCLHERVREAQAAPFGPCA